MSGPISIIYNLNRLGQTGDEIGFSANKDERAALAQLADVLAVTQFEARIALKKLSPNRFALSADLTAQIIQACVVTLEPLPAHIARTFRRELHFVPNLRRDQEKPEKEIAISLDEDEAPEEIGSLHYDLAGPLIEEFVLAIEPYPRAPGVNFTPPGDEDDRPESPFAVLKGLESGPKSPK
jgi:hypothetical protein